ncbi:unnamed protein product [Amaranthus hypochondriacus]
MVVGSRKFVTLLIILMEFASMILLGSEKILRLQKYNGRIHFVPASSYEYYTAKISQEVSSMQDVSFSSLNIKQTEGQAGDHEGPDIELENMN